MATATNGLLPMPPAPTTLHHHHAPTHPPIHDARTHAEMWGGTSQRKGGARDPAAAPAARVTRVMGEMACLDEGGEDAALMSAEGFKAYADTSIWVRGRAWLWVCQGCVCSGPSMCVCVCVSVSVCV
jgi:hypothetical protein